MNSPADQARRLMAAYDACTPLDGTARDDYLDALAREDTHLAARLRAMLSFEPQADGAAMLGVESLVDALVGQRMDEQRADAAPPATIGPFRVRHLLGRGGMGEVWLAEREHDGFLQQVALKRLRSGRDGADLHRRFVQERRILAALSHPGIARFIDGGVTEDGAPWYAMEYVEGVSIVDYVRDRRLEVREQVELLAEVAEAVAYAQNRLVVHRDLKPSNILIDAQGRPHLLDFGIAKLLEDASPGSETATNLRPMSPSYAAPEQVLGEPIGTATDVYALGVVSYQLLTGELPHARESATLETLVERVRTETIEKPSVRLRRHATDAASSADDATRSKLARAVAGDLDTIVLTALRREPERRYANAAALADDLRRWVAGRPIAAQPDTAGYRARKFVARNRLAVGSASGVLLALIAGFGTALWQAREAHVQADLARAEAERANVQAELAQKAQDEAERVNQFFGSMLRDARATDQASGASLTVSNWIATALPRLDAELADAPGARATLRRELGAALYSLGDAAGARTMLVTAVRENREAYGESTQIASAMQMLSVTLYALGEHAEARRVAEEGIAILDRLPEDDELRNLRIQIRTTLLRVYNLMGDLNGALALGERNLAERSALYGADDPRLAVDYNNLSGTLSRLSRLGEAEIALRKTLELLERNPARPVARIAFVEQGLCSLAAQRANYAEGFAACARASEHYVAALGPDTIELASLAATEARVRFMAGEFARAVTLLDEAEPKLSAADRTVDLLEVWLTRVRLATRDRDWERVETISDRLLGALPVPAPGVVSGERVVAEAFAALGRAMRTRIPEDAARARRAAETLLERDDVAANFRASAALAAAVAADASGDAEATNSLRTRGIAALALNMPEADASALWERWWPAARQ